MLFAALEWTNQHTFLSVIGMVVTVMVTKGVDGYLRLRRGVIEIRRDELAVSIQEDERLPPGIKAMVKILDDNVKVLQGDIRGLRLEHEKCLQDHAVASSKLAILEQKHENLKRRVGGSDVISELMPDTKPPNRHS